MKLSGKPWIMNEGRGSRPNPQRMLQASGPQHPDCSFYRGLLQAPAVVGRGDFVPCRGCNMEAVIEWLVDVSSDFTAGVLVFIIFPVLRWVSAAWRAGAVPVGCWAARVGRGSCERWAGASPRARLLLGIWAGYSLGFAVLEMAGAQSHAALVLPVVVPWVIVPVTQAVMAIRQRQAGL